MSIAFKTFKDTYVDSVVQLSAMRAMRTMAGVDWASAAMGTPANVTTLGSQGVAAAELQGVGANDFFIVVRASDDDLAGGAMAAGETAAFAARPQSESTGQAPTRSLRAAVKRQPESNVAVISVPGEYAALAAYQALSLGLHVLLFSDNVPLEKEIALKAYARSQGLLVMGPGAGTAALAGACLGFANVVASGRVGIIAAAGTGAQEAMSLLDRWGVGVSHVIGLGGRDMSADVGGAMALSAIAALREDPGTDVILFVSKPPDPDVAMAVLATAGDTPLVAALIGLDPEFAVPEGVTLTDTLESGVLATLDRLGVDRPDTTVRVGPSLAAVRSRLAPERTLVRGLFSGGTLCYESLVLIGRTVGEVRSNTPINKDWGLPLPAARSLTRPRAYSTLHRPQPRPSSTV